MENAAKINRRRNLVHVWYNFFVKNEKVVIQGDPKQTQIFQAGRTSPKMIFWAQIENFYQFGFMNICYI